LIDPSVSTAAAQRQIGLSARLGSLAVLFFLERLLLSGFVNTQRAQNLGGFATGAWEAQRWGFRFLVAFLATLAVLGFSGVGGKFQSLGAIVRARPIQIPWLLAHAVLVAALIPLSYSLYSGNVVLLPFGALLTIWILVGGLAIAAVGIAIVPWSVWLQGARALGIIWLYAAVAAMLGTGAWQLSETLWEPAASVTFSLVQHVLSPVLPWLTADPVTRILSTDRFAVQITETCSGLEGMGLMLAFTVAWLIYFRREYIFPRALMLIPMGLLAIFALNVVRIAVLMLIGVAGFPDIASFGFHSQAGWIAFNAAACALVIFSRKSSLAHRTEVAHAADSPNHAAVYLMPLLALLAAAMVSRALSGSGGFEVLYPLRFLAGAWVLWSYREDLLAMSWKWSWRAPAAAVLVFLVWLEAAAFLLPDVGRPAGLSMHTPTFQGVWIAVRFASSVLLVPIAEELAYRGYLMRRLGSGDFTAIKYEWVGWTGLLVSAIAFGLSHGLMWLPGIFAGLVFGLLAKRTGSLGEAVVAHGFCNALVGLMVLFTGKWQLW
jgi:exosortase E/protease (VPEID-CTERM system)